jgi:hypothetical protein
MMLIKYATRGRPEWFRKAIANIYSTISNPNFTIAVTIDIDDLSMNTPEIFSFMEKHENIMWTHGRSESKVHAINRDMYQFDKLNWDVLVVMSDDMEFVVQGWDNVIRQRVKDTWGDSQDWFAHFDDGYVHDALATMSIMGRDYFERDGYIYHPAYKSFSCDAEAHFVAVTRGRHKYFPEILARHQHPTNTPGKNDETYIVNSKHTPHDTRIYWARLNSDFGMKEEGYKPPFIWDKYKTK